MFDRFLDNFIFKTAVQEKIFSVIVRIVGRKIFCYLKKTLSFFSDGLFLGYAIAQRQSSLPNNSKCNQATIMR